MNRLPGGTATRSSGGGGERRGDRGAASAGGRGNGDGAGGDPDTSPGGPQAAQRPPGPSTRPALVVLGIAAFLTVVGGVAAVLTSSGGRPAPPARSSSPAAGPHLQAVAAGPTLTPLVAGGLPPQDVLGSVVLPQSTGLVPSSATDNGVGLYDHSVGLTIPASAQAVIDFFRAELLRWRWHILSRGPAPRGGYRIIAQRPGSNGYEWELGVTVMPETFSGSSPAGAPASGATPFTLRLFEVSDSQ